MHIDKIIIRAQDGEPVELGRLVEAVMHIAAGSRFTAEFYDGEACATIDCTGTNLVGLLRIAVRDGLVNFIKREIKQANKGRVN